MVPLLAYPYVRNELDAPVAMEVAGPCSDESVQRAAFMAGTGPV